MNTVTKFVERGIKGRKPRIVSLVQKYIGLHGERLPVADIDTAIASLTTLRAQRISNALVQVDAPVVASVETQAESQPENTAAVFDPSLAASKLG